jgi:DNA-binding NarL/FixJ family response regulator
MHRCQILLASAEGQVTTTIAHNLRCTEQTVRNVMHAFHQRGLKVRGSTPLNQNGSMGNEPYRNPTAC